MQKMLLVKTSFMGDVIHNPPPVNAISSTFPGCLMNWVVGQMRREIHDAGEQSWPERLDEVMDRTAGVTAIFLYMRLYLPFLDRAAVPTALCGGAGDRFRRRGAATRHSLRSRAPLAGIALFGRAQS
jgi:hypothetical protein